MGSLMAGWDSPVLDRKADEYKKNWSFTKGEVEAFWKSRKKIEEEHLNAIISSSQESTPENEFLVKKHKRSSSLPLANTKEGVAVENEASLENLIKNHGWWTKSNWAFLNEPPVLGDATSNTYSTQCHVAKVDDDKKYEAKFEGIIS